MIFYKKINIIFIFKLNMHFFIIKGSGGFRQDKFIRAQGQAAFPANFRENGRPARGVFFAGETPASPSGK